MKKFFVTFLDKLGMGKNSFILGSVSIIKNLKDIFGDDVNVEELSDMSTELKKVFKVYPVGDDKETFYLVYNIVHNAGAQMTGYKVVSVEIKEKL